MTVANATFLVTGGAGSIGSALVKTLEKEDCTILVFDNNEYGLSCLEGDVDVDKVKLIYADVRDKERIEYVLNCYSVDVVVHLAALKRVESSESNPSEAIKVNVLGTQNLIDVCLKHPPKKFLLTSSDKAVPTESGISLYGATKFLQEKLVLSANGINGIKCSVARFGNVMGTRGDVLELWNKQIQSEKEILITDPKMKRFYWLYRECMEFIMMCLNEMEGGEIFVPKMPEYNIVDLARQFHGDNVKIRVTGLRPGEVLLQELMTKEERLRAKEFDWGWIIK